MNKFKLKFSNPTIILEGKKTTMDIGVYILFGKMIFTYKVFKKSITCKKQDKYDLNKAKNILQAYIEQRAYLWAKKIIDKEIEKEQLLTNELKSFSEKATHIIEHDADYINRLMI